MTSIEIKEFKQAIVTFVMQCSLPDEIKRMVLEDILQEQESITLETLKREIAERDAAGQEETQNAESAQ